MAKASKEVLDIVEEIVLSYTLAVKAALAGDGDEVLKHIEQAGQVVKRLHTLSDDNPETDGVTWRPVETAPKDGSAVLLYSSTNMKAENGRWALTSQLSGIEDQSADAAEGYWVEKPYIGRDLELYSYRLIQDVSHWMPLPEPPNDTP